MKTKVVKEDDRYIVKVKTGIFSKWFSVGDAKTGKLKRYCIRQQAEYVADLIAEGKFLWKKVEW